jgi:hypothetical protein
MLLGCAAGAVASARPAPQGAAGFECRAAKCAMGFTKSFNGTHSHNSNTGSLILHFHLLLLIMGSFLRGKRFSKVLHH